MFRRRACKARSTPVRADAVKLESMEMLLREKLAYNMRVARERSGISQRRFGMMVGLSRSHVMDIESARVNITLDTLERVAYGLGVEPWELLI